MAVQFSMVTAIAGNKKSEFLIVGIPKEYEDLERSRKFEEFLTELDKETTVHIHADSYLYSEEEVFTAPKKEVAYFMLRMEQNPSFLQDSCTKGDSSDFDFTWSPEELFGLELKTP